MRAPHLLALLPLCLPLLGGSCFFSSSSGDTTVVIATNDCVGTPENPSPCTPDPEPMATIEARLEVHRQARALVEAPRVPALGGPGLALLASSLSAVAARALRPLR